MSFSILVLSDLHYTGEGAPKESADRKATVGPTTDELVDDLGKRFIERLRSLKQQLGEEGKPKAVIVTGDVVDRGGAGVHNGINEFDHARKFLLEVANVLDLNPARILVIPGNHDVTWKAELPYEQRFAAFLNAMREGGFTTTADEAKRLSGRWYEIPNAIGDMSVEILLLVSPTFSGTVDAEPRKFSERLLKGMPDSDEATKQAITEVAKKLTGFVDIAAIGSEQRRLITARTPGEHASRHADPVRIAALHHHLLPDNQLELAHFESVVDSGRVLQELIDAEFDLVLTGHKHNRRLAHYRVDGNDRTLDVFSSPSLYHKGGVRPGFTIVEVHGPHEPFYATIHEYALDRGGAGLEQRSTGLIRTGRVVPRIREVCSEISVEHQTKVVVPVLEGIRKSFAWRKKAPPLFDVMWKSIESDLASLARKSLIFHPPLVDRWTELIEYIGAGRKNRELLLVSIDDLDYWLTAGEVGTDPYDYSKPLNEYRGQKSRAILITAARIKTERTKLEVVVPWMIKHGFKVIIAPPNVTSVVDFGILGGRVVSRFHERSRGARTLVETFDSREVAKRADDWREIVRAAYWRSDSTVSFRSFLSEICAQPRKRTKKRRGGFN